VTQVDGLLAAYRRSVVVPWPQNVAPAQRVWMLVYPPEWERRVRLHLEDFATATKEAGHEWSLIDVTTAFERWMGAHEYRDSYFADPELLDSALPDFFESLCAEVTEGLNSVVSAPTAAVGLTGVGSLFGLEGIKVSALLDRVADSVQGRLVVFFPGRYDGSNYRLLDARDGWNYLAIPITAEGVG
jgi:hypothetical protein